MQLKKIKKYAIPLICGLATIILMRFVFFIGFVPSPSMEPAIHQGSYVFGVRIFDKLDRGDIIIFKRNGRTLVKRIAAVSGDMIYMDDNLHQAWVNTHIKTAIRTLIVPDGCYFVLGDNHNNSWDSRYWDDAWVKESDIIAYVP